MRSAGFIQLQAALVGDFDREVHQGRRNVEIALGAGMEELAQEVVGKLRQDVAASGLRGAERLKTAAWRHRTYGRGNSLSPAAQIFSRIPIVIQAFENGQIIRARGGSALLIPNSAVWPGGRMRGRRGMSMGDVWSIATARFGPLTVVKRPGRTTIVIAQVRESARNPGTFRKASAAAQRRAEAGNYAGLTTVVVFVMAREAQQPRMLRGRVIRERVQRDAPGRLDQLFIKHFAVAGEGPRRLT